MTVERESLGACWRNKGAWAIHLAGAMALAASCSGWFWIPDSNALWIGVQALAAIATVTGILWLTGAMFIFYRREHAGGVGGLGTAFRAAPARLGALLAWFAITACAVLLALRWPQGRWISAMIVLFLVPVGSSVAVAGFRGFALNVWKLRYFAASAVILAAGFWLPRLLWRWQPGRGTLAAETVSLGIRATLAAAIIVTCWQLLASLLGRLGAESPAPSS